MKKIDLSKVLKEYKKGWIALSEDYKKVLYQSNNFSSLMDKVEQAGIENRVVLMPASKNYRGFIGKIE